MGTMSKQRFKLAVTVQLLLEKDGKLLLHLRQNSSFANGYYGLVSGHIDGNETVRQAMIREAREEAGIKSTS